MLLLYDCFFGYSHIFSIVNILYFVTFFNQTKFKDYENLSILREFIVLFSQIISRYFCIILTNYVELCNCFLVNILVNRYYTFI